MRGRRASAAAWLVGALVAGAGVAGPVGPAVAQSTPTTVGRPTSSTTVLPKGLSVESFGATLPWNAPDQRLAMERVTARPGATIFSGARPGVALMRVEAGTATAVLERGDLVVIDRTGGSRTVPAPAEVRVRTGETLVQLPLAVHRAENRGSRRLVATLAILTGRDLPTSVPSGGVTDPPIALTTDLIPVDNRLADAPPDLRYGWNHLVGTSDLDGQTVRSDMLANVAYRSGRGPFFGFVTFTWPDGSSLVTEMFGEAVPQAGGSTVVQGLLTITAGTGRYAGANGYGTILGRRNAAIGVAVATAFTLVPSATG